MDPEDPWAAIRNAYSPQATEAAPPPTASDPWAAVGNAFSSEAMTPKPVVDPVEEPGKIAQAFDFISGLFGGGGERPELQDPMVAAQQPMASDAMPVPGLAEQGPEGFAFMQEAQAEIARRDAARTQIAAEDAAALPVIPQEIAAQADVTSADPVGNMDAFMAALNRDSVEEIEGRERLEALNQRIVELGEEAGVNTDDETFLEGAAEGLSLGLLTRLPSAVLGSGDSEVNEILEELGIKSPNTLGRVLGSMAGVATDVAATRAAAPGLFAKIPQMVLSGRISPRMAAILEGALEGVPSDLLRFAIDERETLATVGLGTALGAAAGSVLPSGAVKGAARQLDELTVRADDLPGTSVVPFDGARPVPATIPQPPAPPRGIDVSDTPPSGLRVTQLPVEEGIVTPRTTAPVPEAQIVGETLPTPRAPDVQASRQADLELAERQPDFLESQADIIARRQRVGELGEDPGTGFVRTTPEPEAPRPQPVVDSGARVSRAIRTDTPREVPGPEIKPGESFDQELMHFTSRDSAERIEANGFREGRIEDRYDGGSWVVDAAPKGSVFFAHPKQPGVWDAAGGRWKSPDGLAASVQRRVRLRKPFVINNHADQQRMLRIMGLRSELRGSEFPEVVVRPSSLDDAGVDVTWHNGEITEKGYNWARLKAAGYDGIIVNADDIHPYGNKQVIAFDSRSLGTGSPSPRSVIDSPTPRPEPPRPPEPPKPITTGEEAISAFSSVLRDTSGAARRSLVVPLGAAAGGTAFGAVTGQTPEDRLGRAALFASLGVLGALAPTGIKLLDARTGGKVARGFGFGGSVAGEARVQADRHLAEAIMRVGERREGFINATNSKVKGFMGDLAAGVRRLDEGVDPGRLRQAAQRGGRAIGIASGDPLEGAPAAVRQAVNETIEGAIDSAEAMARLPEDIAQAAIGIRAQVDGLSTELRRLGLTEGAIGVKVDENIGSYLVRAYRAFNTPKWAEKVEKELGSDFTSHLNRFKDWYRGVIQVSDEEAFAAPVGILERMRLVDDLGDARLVFGRKFREFWKESGSETLDQAAVARMVDDLPDGIVDKRAVKDRLALWYGSAFNRTNPGEVTLEDGFRQLMELGVDDNPLRQMGANKTVGRQILSRLNRDLPPEIKVLLGEIHDPVERYTLSVAKQSKAVAAAQAMTDMRGALEDAGLLWDPRSNKTRPKWATHEIADGDNIPLKPLAGLFTNERMALALQEEFETAVMSAKSGSLHSIIAGLSTTSKIAKVVFNSVAQTRNVISHNSNFIRAGHFAEVFGTKRVAAGAAIGGTVGGAIAGEQGAVTGAISGAGFAGVALKKASIQQLFEGAGIWADTGFRSQFRRLQAAGIVSNNADPNELMSAMRVVGDSRLGQFLQGRWPDRVAKSMYKPAFFAYQAGDDIAKLTLFALEQGRYERAFKAAGKTISDEDLFERAASAVTRSETSYSRVPRNIKKLGRWGGFVSFTSEVIRTAESSLHLIADDLADPVTAGIARRRIAGTMAAYSMSAATSLATAQLFGVGKEERQAIRKMVAPWSRNAPLAYTSSGGTGTEYIDLSYIDPNAYFDRIVIAAVRGTPPREAAADLAVELLSPFLGGTPFLATAVEELRDPKNKNGVDVVLNTLWDGVSPAVMEQMERLITQRTERGMDIPRSTEFINALTGIRTSSVQYDTSLKFGAIGFNKKLREVAEMTRDRDKESRPSSRVRQKVADTVLGSLRSREVDAWREMMDLAVAARRVGLTRRQIQRSLDDARVSKKNIKLIMKAVP